VLLDANILLMPVRSQFPLEAEVLRIRPGSQVAVPSSVLEELDRLLARGVPGARAAVALARSYPVLPVEGRGDKAILDAAVRRRAWVATADRALAARLRRSGVTVLMPRDRHRLETRPGRAPPPTAPRPRTRAEPARRRQRL